LQRFSDVHGLAYYCCLSRSINEIVILLIFRFGVGPVQWTAAKHTRRDLDASQRAAAALALLPLLEKEAKERQKMGQAKLPDPDSAGNAREKAAGLTGASDGYRRGRKAHRGERRIHAGAYPGRRGHHSRGEAAA